MKYAKFINGCVGKIRYRSLKHATRASERVYKKYNDKQMPYFCTQCGWWHLGHTQKEVDK